VKPLEMKRTGPTNPILNDLISELKKRSIEQDANLWKRIAEDLEKPTRQRRAVNLSRISRHTKENETIVVPGKVLGSGTLDHKLTIAALNFSQGALDKIIKAGAKVVALDEISKESPKGKRIRIIG